MYGKLHWTNDRKAPRWATEALHALWPDRVFAWNNADGQWEIVKPFLPRGACSYKYARVGIVLEDDGTPARDIRRHHLIPLKRNRYLELHPEVRLRELVAMEKAEAAGDAAERRAERERGQAYWESHHGDYMRLRGTYHLRPQKVAFQGAGNPGTG